MGYGSSFSEKIRLKFGRFWPQSPIWGCPERSPSQCIHNFDTYANPSRKALRAPAGTPSPSRGSLMAWPGNGLPRNPVYKGSFPAPIAIGRPRGTARGLKGAAELPSPSAEGSQGDLGEGLRRPTFLGSRSFGPNAGFCFERRLATGTLLGIPERYAATHVQTN
jgi:hypothetical protein